MQHMNLGAQGGQKGVLFTLLELELSLQVWTLVLCKSSKHWAVSTVHISYF